MSHESQIPWSEEECDTLRQLAKSRQYQTYLDLTHALNKRCGTHRTEPAVKHYMLRNKIELKRPTSETVTGRKSQKMSGIDVEEEFNLGPDEDDPVVKGHEKGQCAWPFGDPKKGEFCGRPSFGEFSYCEKHYNLSIRQERN